MLFITPYTLEAISQHAIQCYPYECCGFLSGNELNNERNISHFIVCKNEAKIKRTNFLISPADYIKAEKEAGQKNLLLLGIYHSHPDSEALPSLKDIKAAFPFFSYLILSVSHYITTSARCWKLNNKEEFDEEEFMINQNKFSKYKRFYGHNHYSYTSS